MALPPESNTTQTDNELDATVVLNGSEYIFDVILYNGDIAIRLPGKVVHELTIIDNIYSVFHHGYIVLRNEFSSLENYTSVNNFSLGNNVAATSYVFKSNISSDLLIVKIKPKKPPFNEDTLPDADWSLSFIFSIYDEEEIYNPKGTEKLKVFKFKDIREDILANIYLPWSTTSLLAKQNGSSFNISQTSNRGRGVKTGDAIKDIITDTLTDFNNQFDTQWDSGATTLYYSTPANQSRFDALEYILDYHVSFGTYDSTILKLERSGIWSLLPVETYFSRALKKDDQLPGDFTIDIFHIHNQEHNETLSNVKIPPKSKNAYDVRIPLTEFTGLFNYGYHNISGEDSCKELVTTPVHSYDIMKKLFSIDIAGNTITDVQSAFQAMYIDKMHGDPATNTIPVNPPKIKTLLYNPVFTPVEDKIQRTNDGRNRVMEKVLGLSNALTFNLDGFTIRRSGRFISVVNTDSYPDTAFQNIIQGEWFITQVTHTFTGALYRNEITCIKPYSFEALT